MEDLLRPRDLLETARAYIFSKAWDRIGIFDGASENPAEKRTLAYRRANEETERLGREIASNANILEALVPDLVRGDSGRQWIFGRGLAQGAIIL